VLFDWDNTLVDSWPVIHDALNVTFAAFGLPSWTLAETRARVRKSMRDSFPALFGERWQDAGDVFYERYAAIHAEKVVPVAGAAAMLASLAEDGFYLGVVSNKKGDFLRLEAGHLGWGRYFGRLVGAFDAERDKPAREPVVLALAGSGIAPGPEVWLAGDADIDLECAVNAGCVPVLVRPVAPAKDEFATHPPARYFADCLALSKTIKGL
jgi:phosphoglycolate phosphatase